MLYSVSGYNVVASCDKVIYVDTERMLRMCFGFDNVLDPKYPMDMDLEMLMLVAITISLPGRVLLHGDINTTLCGGLFVRLTIWYSRFCTVVLYQSR